MKLKINGVKKFNHLGKIEVIFISKKELSITSIIPNTKRKHLLKQIDLTYLY
jgi:hypothetical protein